MVNFEIVTETAERVRQKHPYRAIFLPHLIDAQPGSQDHTDWTLQNSHLINFQVLADDKPKALELALELDARWKEVKSMADSEVVRILDELEKLRARDMSTFTALEKWTANALNMSEYSGNANLLCLIATALSEYDGMVIEAMCGHNSYFAKKKGRKITALDYCKPSLLRYSHPKAKRICCDLNQVMAVGDLAFLKDDSHDAISICFGYKYPEDIGVLMAEFRRVLKPGGVLSFVESRTHGYPELVKRKFRPRTIRRQLLHAGFSRVAIEPLNQVVGVLRRSPTELVYHTQAFK